MGTLNIFASEQIPPALITTLDFSESTTFSDQDLERELRLIVELMLDGSKSPEINIHFNSLQGQFKVKAAIKAKSNRGLILEGGYIIPFYAIENIEIR